MSREPGQNPSELRRLDGFVPSRLSLWAGFLPVVLLALALSPDPLLGATAKRVVYPSKGAPTVGRPTPTPIAALWVTRQQLQSPEQVDQMLLVARRIGARMLFVQAVARGDATYLSSYLPPAHPLSAFDALAYLVPRARALKLEVHAWVSAFLVWSSYELPTDARHLLRSRPEMLTYSPNLSLETQWDITLHAEQFRQGVFMKPSNRAARSLVQSVVEEIVLQYQVDGVFLDYIRYPSYEIPIDEETRTAFHRRFYAEPPPLPPRPFRAPDREAVLWGTSFPDNDASFGEFAPSVLETPPDVTETPADFLPEIRDPIAPFPLLQTANDEQNERMEDLYKNWVLWKAEQVSETVLGIRRKMFQNYPDLYLSASVIPDIAHARNDLGQDWTRWVKDGWVDFVIPSFFAVNTNLVRDQMNNVSAAVETRPVIAGIGIYNEEPETAAEKIKAAMEVGYSGVALFSYDTLAYTPGYWQRLKLALEKGP